MRTAMGRTVQPPSPWAMARVVSVEGLAPWSVQAAGPAMRMTKAVAVHTTMVSTNTPRDWMSPCWTGWATVAVAAALGAVP